VSSGFVVDAVRTAWLTLALMMLVSRVVFQVAGPRRMRAFLDGWQRGSVKRIWGAAALAFAIFISASAVAAGSGYGAFDLVLIVALVAILLTDGAVNALPSGFETFKDRLQAAWVSRARGARQGDAHLFGTVNALLALASAAVAAIVIAYQPIDAVPVLAAVVASLVLTTALIAASVLTAPQR
jgi:hypothetical protein